MPEAIDSYSRAIELKSAEPDYYLNRAIAYRINRQYQQALDDCRSMLKLDANNYYAINQIAYIYFDQGQIDRAVKEIEKAIKIKPDNGDLYDSRAEFYIAQGKYAEALADAEKTLALDPGFSLGYYRKGVALSNMLSNKEIFFKELIKNLELRNDVMKERKYLGRRPQGG